MSIIQEAVTLSALWFAAGINLCIVGHIAGAQVGTLIGKLFNCVVGFDIHFIDEAKGYRKTEHFKGWSAWTVQGDIETMERWSVSQAMVKIEGEHR